MAISNVFDPGMNGLMKRVIEARPGEREQAMAVAQPQGEQQGERGREGLPITAIHVAKNSLNGGEISAWMGGRFDQPRYQSGCHRLLNMVPLPCGGITKRPGIVHLGEGAQKSPARATRLLPFIFSATEARMLEFYEKDEGCGMRVWIEGKAGKEALTLPWAGAILNEIDFCQSADVIYCAHEEWAPAKIMRLADDKYKYEVIRWTPSIKAPKIIEIREHTTPNTGSVITFQYRVTAIDRDTGEESLPSAVFIRQAQPLTSDHTLDIVISPVAGAVEYRIYKREGGVFGFIGRITEADGNGDWLFNDNNIAPDTEDTPPNYKDPFKDKGDYPSVCFLHQQRLGFASTRNQPLTIWLSASGSYENMAASLPPNDDDAIEVTLAASQASRILWAHSDRAGLAFGTSGGEWLLTGQDSAALTPSNLSFQPQSNYGSEPFLKPLMAGSALTFTQRGGSVIRDLSYNYADDRYQSADLSILARHILADNPITSWCWQPEPYGIIWAALKDGSLAGLTYLREHEIIAWHRHTTEGQILSVASLPLKNGNSQLWLEVVRLVNNQPVRHIEALGDFMAGIPLGANDWTQTDLDDSPAGFASSRQPSPANSAPAPERSLADILAAPQAIDASLATHKDGLAQTEYPARCIPCLPVFQTDNGVSYLRVTKLNSIKVRVVNSAPFKARILSQKFPPSPLMPVPNRQAPFVTEADWAANLAAGFRDNTRLELVCDSAYPVTILALIVVLELAGNNGNQ